jgi:hypothetical protein
MYYVSWNKRRPDSYRVKNGVEVMHFCRIAFMLRAYIGRSLFELENGFNFSKTITEAIPKV